MYFSGVNLKSDKAHINRPGYSYLFTLYILLISSMVNAQYASDWIYSGNTYVKFGVIQEGIYRISLDDIPAAWKQDTARLQLFHDGHEVPIRFTNTQPLFLEFYGRRHDGVLDSAMYVHANDQPHPFYSLITDSSFYFLTQKPISITQSAMRFHSPDTSVLSGLLPLSQIPFTSRTLFTQNYYRGSFYPMSEPYYISEYAGGEGWFQDIGTSLHANVFTGQQVPNTDLNYTIQIAGNSNAMSGSSGFNHHLRIWLKDAGAHLIKIQDALFSGYGLHTWQGKLSGISLSDSTELWFEVPNDIGVSSDQQMVSYVQLNYIRKTEQWSGASFELYANNPQRIDFTGMSLGTYDVCFPNQGILSSYSSNSSLVSVLIPAQHGPCFMLPKDSIRLIHPLYTRVLQLPDSTIHAECILISHPSLQAAAEAYTQYRAKQYACQLLYTDALYDVFSYGYSGPLAIRRVCYYLYQNAFKKPLFLVLLGRGYQTNLTRLSSSPHFYTDNLVPAWGDPSSDQLFTEGLDGGSGYGSIATGRIPASTNAELQTYLDKLIEAEKASDSIAFWKKTILHLSGGSYDGEQVDFKQILQARAQTASQSKAALHVVAYNKNATSPTQTDLKSTLVQEIAQGKSVVTFFGHGSMTILDLDFGSIQDQRNAHRYPFFYFNGCNIGNANDIDPGNSGEVYGKTFLCAANKGAIGWLASTNFTLRDALDAQTNAIYQAAFGTQYAKPIGLVIREGLKTTFNQDPIIRSHNLQLLLQGDPMYHWYTPSLPDVQLSAADIFTVSSIHASMDSFPLFIRIQNAGASLSDSMRLDIIQTTPDRHVYTYTLPAVPVPAWVDTVLVWVHPHSAGINQFQVQFNADKKIVESDYSQNNALAELFIPGSALQPIYPGDYAIIPSDSVYLLVQHSDLFTKQAVYEFQLDTSPYFITNSPEFQTSGLIQTGALAKYLPAKKCKPNMVYFWRARLEGVSGQESDWIQGSFYSSGDTNTGWTMRSVYQFMKGVSGDYAFYDTLSKQLRFADDIKSLGVYVRRWNANGNTITSPYILNAQVYKCLAEGVVATVFDPYRPDIPIEAKRFPFSCQNIIDNKNGANDISLRYYTFNTNTIEGVNQLTAFIDSLDEGTPVAFFSRYNSSPNTWTPALRQALQSVGSIKAAALQSPYSAWALIGTKGAISGTAAEDTLYNDRFIGQSIPNPNDQDSSGEIRFQKQLKGRWFTGTIQSPVIGPALSWKEVNTVYHSLEGFTNGSVRLSIYGLDSIGNRVLLRSNLPVGSIGISDISAKTYPFLQLSIQMTDSQYRTPEQPDIWQVLYETAGDWTFNADTSYQFHAPQIEPGDSILVQFGIWNLGQNTMPPTTILWEVRDANRQLIRQQIDSISSMKAHGYMPWKTRIATWGLKGTCEIRGRINPQEQVMETRFSNNTILQTCSLKEDHQNPYLDVRFDGYRIMNGDYVSAQPLIEIQLKDNSRFLPASDTSLIHLQWRKPGSFDFERIPFSGNPTIQTSVSAIPGNYTVFFRPGKLDDGVYSIKIQATDISGNNALNSDYQVDFTVDHQSKISYFYPYPNPFTTRAHFAFTLTGSTVPDQFVLRLFTVSGKLIREVHKEEFGTMHIGNNISEFAWDGTDQFGDKVGSGVYLYQVSTSLQGKEPEHFRTGNMDEDRIFIHQTGKIVLIR